MAAQPSRPLAPSKTDLPTSRSRRHQGRRSPELSATDAPLTGPRSWFDRVRIPAGQGHTVAPNPLPRRPAPRPESQQGSTWNIRLSRTGTPGRTDPSERRPRAPRRRGLARWAPRTRRSVAQAHRCTGPWVVPSACCGAAPAHGRSVEHGRARPHGAVARRTLRPSRTCVRS